MLYDKSLQAVLKDLSVNLSAEPIRPIASASAAAGGSEAAMEAIKRYILTENLKPGDPLPTEAKLCAELNVSRTSVREALRRLAALDIITSHQGRGTFVGEMSMRPLVETLILRCNLNENLNNGTLNQVIQLRRSLDLGIAETITGILPTTDVSELEDLVKKMEAKAANGELFTEEDYAFHTKLLGLLGNPLLTQLTSAMWLIHMASVPSLRSTSTETLCKSAATHQDIISAAKAGDVAAYCNAVVAHYAPLEIRIQ